MEKLYQQYRKQDVVILSVHSGPVVHGAKEFAKKWDHPVVVQSKSIPEDYIVQSLPVLFIINKKGKVLKRLLSEEIRKKDYLESEIESLLQSPLARNGALNSGL